MLIPRDYQQETADDAITFLRSAQPGEKRMYAAPTGTGKSIPALLVLQALPGAILVAPRVEIIRDMLSKLGVNLTAEVSEDAVIATAESIGIVTPITLRNRLIAGEMSAPQYLIIDEGHHDIATTYQQIALLCGDCPAIAFTATPYRATPRTTQALRKIWGEPRWMITLPDAVRRGFLAFPRCEVWPLIDDDLITVENGELVAEQVCAAVACRVDHIACRVAEYFDRSPRPNVWDRPTMFAMPSRDLCGQMQSALRRLELPSVVVTGETPYRERQKAFAACIDRSAALIQVYVVSEGVDLPIRRLIDCSPCISPVRWMQQLGRITRPTANQPHYIATNRNLLRHAYLLEGLLPRSVYVEAEIAFGGPGKRAAQRAIGLEALGRLKGAELPLANGGKALMYAVADVTDGKITEYTVICHPLRSDILWATRRRISGSEEYGKWSRCDPPPNLEGFASVSASPLSEKQEAWWKRAAKRHGLDSEAEITRKQFQALPVLSHLGETL
jgi:superfamily II DNA or RNA helicase